MQVFETEASFVSSYEKSLIEITIQYNTLKIEPSALMIIFHVEKRTHVN
jgi:hypothetical protein